MENFLYHDNHIDTYKLEGHEQYGEEENATRDAIHDAKSLDELKTILHRHKYIIHRDTDYRTQNILESVRLLQLGHLTLADMPEEYGIRRKLADLLKHTHNRLH